MAKYPWDDLLVEGKSSFVPADKIDNFDSFRAAAYQAAATRDIKVHIRQLDGGYGILAYPKDVELDEYLAAHAGDVA